jgi:hypothetical protein
MGLQGRYSFPIGGQSLDGSILWFGRVLTSLISDGGMSHE